MVDSETKNEREVFLWLLPMDLFVCPANTKERLPNDAGRREKFLIHCQRRSIKIAAMLLFLFEQLDVIKFGAAILHGQTDLIGRLFIETIGKGRCFPGKNFDHIVVDGNL